MSTQSGTELVSNIEGNFLSCAICRDKYTKPRVLPCQHSYCEACLESYIITNEYWDTLPCPTCRVHTDVPRQGASGFPINHLIIGLADCMENYAPTADSDVWCENCADIGEENRPTVYCCVCRHTMCETCEAAHKRLRVTRSHPTKPVESFAANGHGVDGKDVSESAAVEQLATKVPASTVSPDTNEEAKHSEQILETNAPGSSSNSTTNQNPSTNGQPETNAVTRRPSEQVAFEAESRSTWYVSIVPQVTRAELLETVRICSGESDIWDLCVDQDQNIYVIDIEGERVKKCNMEGHNEKNFAMSGRNKLKNPYHIACTHDNRIVILDDEECLKIFTPQQNFVTKFGKFHDPQGLAVNLNNEIVLVEQGECHIFNQEGGVVRTFRLRPLPEWCGAYIATDSKNNIVISFSLLHLVQAFTETGDLLWSYGCEGTGVGQLKHPRGLCVDKFDNVLIADSGNHRVVLLSANGEFKRNLIRMSDDTFCPTGVATSNSNKLLVASRYQSQVLIYEYLTFCQE